MPLRHLQLQRGSNYDLVSLRGVYNPENNVVEKSQADELDADDWTNWLRWDAGAIELLNPGEELGDENASSLCSPNTTFSDIEFSGKHEASHSLLSQNGTPFEDAPFDVDEDNKSTLFSPISSTGSLLLPEHYQPYDLAAGFPFTSNVGERPIQAAQARNSVLIEIESIPETRSARLKLARPLKTDAPARRGRKRITIEETKPDITCLSKKRGHNAIEKRYRTNLNEKINCLRDALPSLCKSTSDAKADESDDEEIDSKSGQQKFGKAAVLTRALEYIKHLELNTQQLGKEIDTLKGRVNAFERLALSGDTLEESESLKTLPLSTGQTLENIQEEFKQIETKSRSRSRSIWDPVPPRKRTKRQGKNC